MRYCLIFAMVLVCLTPDRRIVVAQANPVPQKASACHFLRPIDLPEGATVWLGACRAGQADGAGTLRVTRRGDDPMFFYGTMLAGQPTRGVVTQDDGHDLIAYRFDGARLIEPTTTQQIVEIYKAAAEGAAATARYFRERGNAASAKYYDYASHLLATALDRPE